MKTKYFKCTLLTDVVLNASLATEGNMQSLDFIPGSNFLGIVAKKYKDFGSDALDIFHSEKVKFGDALISKTGKLSYALPFSLFQDKLENKILKDTAWVHHGITNFKEIKDKEGKTRQLKQNRKGYLNTEKKYIDKVEKNFALKSAYDAKQRRSKESAMFGFDAIKAGQEFIFSVSYEDESYFEQIKNALVGTKRLGKSKTAQYGQVEIKEIDKLETFSSKPNENNQLVIYAESRLCFLNEYGSPTFQPKPKDFQIEAKDFAWDKCQIRIGSYSPWNAKRNTPDSQRSFIERGSVFVIEYAENDNKIDTKKLSEIVGEYQNEGFGRVIYNPEFLNYKPDENGIWSFQLSEYPKEDKNIEEIEVNSTLGKFLKAKSERDENELKIGKKIIDIFKEEEKEKILLSDKITKSQWGGIRTFATQHSELPKLMNALFGISEVDYKLISNDDNLEFDKKIQKLQEKSKETGYLMHGVADEKIWGKNKGKRRKTLMKVIEDNKELETQFVAKLAAEIAKKQDNNG